MVVFSLITLLHGLSLNLNGFTIRKFSLLDFTVIIINLVACVLFSSWFLSFLVFIFVLPESRLDSLLSSSSLSGNALLGLNKYFRKFAPARLARWKSASEEDGSALDFILAGRAFS